MTKIVRSLMNNLMIGLATPILGGLLALPVVAQTAALESPQQLSPVQRLLLERKLANANAKPAPLTPLTTFLATVENTGENVAENVDQNIDQTMSERIEQPIELILRLQERQLYVYRGNTLEASFPVAVGKPDWETPTGNFEILYKIENPGWTHPFTGEVVPPGPENPLGERWIAFWTDGQHEIGFHGTPNRASIGQASSHGCVRLYNEHIRELYTLANPGTRVTILP